MQIIFIIFIQELNKDERMTKWLCLQYGVDSCMNQAKLFIYVKHSLILEDKIIMNELDWPMLFISDGNSEIGAHVWNNFGFKICVRHLFRLKTSI